MDNSYQWKNKRGALSLAECPYSEHTLPHKEVLSVVKSKKALFARWTSEWDCGYPTEWWYCIKDNTIALTQFKSKVRNEISRGLRTTEYFLADINVAHNYLDVVFEISKQCFQEYPAKYRPSIEKGRFIKKMVENLRGGGNLWLCRDISSQTIVGYSMCKIEYGSVNMTKVHVLPAFLRNRVNAGLVFTLCQYYLNSGKYKYISDGQRNIVHETNYQAFLVKTLGFRYAYCRLNVVYHPAIKVVVKVLYPFRGLLRRLSGLLPKLYSAYCLLKQEEYVRSFK